MIERSPALGLTVHAATDEALVVVPPPPASEPEIGPPLPRGGWKAVGPDQTLEAAFDDDLTTAWTGSTLESPSRFVVDLGTQAMVTAIALDLGPHLRRYLRTYRVEGSLDGRQWMPLAEAAVATPPLASYRADHHRIRQTIILQPATVRRLRIGPYRPPPIRSIAPDAGWARWGVAELSVYGAALF